jgi:BirA family biotin operon repressor/biotin-[acetyl-CoA-carboxylase] ligase
VNAEFQNTASMFPDPFRLLVRESSTSTNDDLRKLADDGAPEGLVLLALEQTQGRGRRGAAWFSEPGESLAFSILVRPSEPKSLWPRLALAAGAAVAEAMEQFGVQAGIKWPNDVWVRGLKLAGILVEAGKDFAIVGIGINVGSRRFPAEVAEIATSLALETSTEISRAEVLGAVVRRFASRQRQIGPDFGILLDSVREHCVLTGKQVALMTSSGPKQGLVEGIAPGGELMLRTAGAVENLIQADEVRILA